MTEDREKPIVRLISITPDAEKTMAYMARVSSSNQDNPEIAGLLRYCIKHKHWSVFEMANMVIEINTSRGISPQILRHDFRFQEFSQRYAAVDESGLVLYAARRQDDKNRQNSIDDLPEHVQLEWMTRQQTNWQRAFEHYQWALDAGIAKECARMVLPLQTATRLYAQGTVRNWIHYIELRSAHGTQREHQEIAEAAKWVFCRELPVVAEALGWPAVGGAL